MKQDYKERFLRSIGIFTEKELEIIKKTPIAIAGLGLGGSIFLNLVRMGYEKFHIADPDTYERTNINRQRMAKESTIGKRKDDSVLKEAKDINPDVQIRVFKEGVKPENLERFLGGIKYVVDVVDLFALPDKLALNAEARKKLIPVFSCATLGFTACMVVFDKNTPSFAELTGMKPDDPFSTNLDKFFRFICPYVPDYMHEQLMKSLSGSSYIPFVVPGGEITAGLAATEITKNILQWDKRIMAPQGVFVDPVKMQIQIFEASHKFRTLENKNTEKKKAA